MNLTPAESRKLRNLFVLADLCSDTDLVNLKLCSFYETLREEHGLAKLLLMIQQHAKNETCQNQAPSPQTSESRTGEEATDGSPEE